MATIEDYLEEFRLEISDDPEDVLDRIYTDRKLARLFRLGTTMEYNRIAPQQISVSGEGPKAVITPVPAETHQTLLFLHWALAVARFEERESSRVGFSVSNVAGRVDGRERFTTARENVRDLRGRISREIKSLGLTSTLNQMVFRPAERNPVSASGSSTGFELGV